MPSPDLDLVDYLAGAGLGLTKGTNIFVGPVRDMTPQIPDNSVFVTTRGGRLPVRTMGLQEEVRSPLIFIRIRNKNYDTGYNLAKAIMTSLMSGGVAGYLDIEPMQSEPNFLQTDSKNRLMWDLSYLMKYGEVSA